jgi:hypothetical protein
MTLTRRQALALAATAPVAAVLPTRPNVILVPGYAALYEWDRRFWAAVQARAARDMKRQLIAMVKLRDQLFAERPPVQLSTPSTPQENRDRNHMDEACGTKSVL